MPDRLTSPSPQDWASREIDARGLVCPQPMIALGRLLREETARPLRVELTSDDPTTALDLPAWCRLTGHVLDSSKTDGSATTYQIHIVR